MSLATIYSCLEVRRAHPELGPGGSLEILHDGYPWPIFAVDASG